MEDEVAPEPSPEDYAAVRDTTSYDAPAKPAKKRDKQNGSYLPDIHRLLPKSEDAEQGVICSILLAPKEVIAICAERGIAAEHFHIPAHAIIYGTLYAMGVIETQAIDLVTLTQRLRDDGKLDQCGGAAFITHLFTFLPTAANATYYLEILEEKFTLREIIRVCTEYAGRSYDEQSEVTNLLDEVESRVLAISKHRYAKANLTGAKEAVMSAIHAIEDFYNSKGTITGLPTGFPALDKMLDGLHKSEMIVIAARPSMGKTSLAMGMAEHLAVECKIPVGIFSLEMTTDQLMQRMLCSRARVDLTRVREGFLAERDFPALTAAASKIAEAAILFDDSSDVTIQELRGRARRMVQLYNVQAIFIDYLQLLRSNTKRAQENRQVEVSDISAGLKAMAKELGIPVVVLAQLNRRVDDRGSDGKPRLSDLRESGSIEQDADVVAFLTRPEVYAEDDETKKQLYGMADLLIAKQRNGPIGEVALTFLKQFTRFESRAQYGDDEEPQQQGLGI